MLSHDTVAVSGRCGAQVATACRRDDQCLGERRGKRSMDAVFPDPVPGSVLEETVVFGPPWNFGTFGTLEGLDDE